MKLTGVLSHGEDGAYPAPDPDKHASAQVVMFEDAVTDVKEAIALYLFGFPLSVQGYSVECSRQ